MAAITVLELIPVNGTGLAAGVLVLGSKLATALKPKNLTPLKEVYLSRIFRSVEFAAVAVITVEGITPIKLPVTTLGINTGGFRIGSAGLLG
jgi:hypothetical protein